MQRKIKSPEEYCSMLVEIHYTRLAKTLGVTVSREEAARFLAACSQRDMSPMEVYSAWKNKIEEKRLEGRM